MYSFYKFVICSLLFNISSFAYLFSEEKLVIHQTALEGKELTTFISVYDKNNRLVEGLRAEDFKVNYGLNEGTINSLKPFSSAQYGTSYVFMVDVSKSVTKENFQTIKNSIKSWIKSLNPGDAAAIIAFGEDVTTLSELSYDRNRLLGLVEDGILRTDMRTKLYEGIKTAYSLASVADKRFPARRAIICLTDGVNESNDETTKDDVLSLFDDNPIPFYSINFTEDLNNEVRVGAEELKEISSVSNGSFFDANKISIEMAYKSARKYIDEAHMLISTCNECVYNNSVINFKVSYSGTNINLSSTSKIKLTPFEEEAQFAKGERKETWRINYLFLSIAITLVIIIIVVTLLRQKITNKEFSESDEDRFQETVHDVNENEPLSIRISSLSTNINEIYNVSIDKRLTIGRSSKCDLSIPDQPEISGNHCLLELKENSVSITDLNSRNGTFVNGVRITDRFILQSRDIVGLGRAEYRLIFGEED